MSEQELWVTGMKCSGCERSVEQAVAAVDGVSSARADHTTGKVTVVVSAAVETERLIEAVRAAGYGVD